MPEQDATSTEVWSTDASDVSLVSALHDNNFQVAGWVHSHPTFSAFLSAPDVHMATSYQLLRKDCVSVVTDEYEVPHYFRMLPEGLEVVKKCNLTGFHEHTPATCELYERVPVKIVRCQGEPVILCEQKLSQVVEIFMMGQEDRDAIGSGPVVGPKPDEAGQ